jgi:hypothetical protein
MQREQRKEMVYEMKYRCREYKKGNGRRNRYEENAKKIYCE